MFMFKVFAAIAVTLATATHGAPNLPAKHQNVYNCSGVDIPLSKMANVKWYILTSTLQFESCETLTIFLTSNNSGYVIDKSLVDTENFSFSHYDHGCFKFLVYYTAQDNIMIIKLFSEESTYNTAVLYDIPDPKNDPNRYAVVLVASVNNLPQAKIDALQEEAITADPRLRNAKFYLTNKSNCTY